MEERRVQSGIVAMMLALPLSGCAATQTKQAIETEQILAASGFQIRLAGTPEKTAHLNTLTQRKFVPHDRDGSVHYVYADAASCKCSYVGTEKAYQRYQKLALQKKIADEQRKAAQLNLNAKTSWGLWGWW